MKKVLIIGASGSLATYVIEALNTLENVELTLFVRNKSRLSKSKAAFIARIIETPELYKNENLGISKPN